MWEQIQESQYVSRDLNQTPSESILEELQLKPTCSVVLNYDPVERRIGQ
jgi:hypothetical protein